MGKEKNDTKVKRSSLLVTTETRDKLLEILEVRQQDEVFKVTQIRLLTALINEEYERLGLDKKEGK